MVSPDRATRLDLARVVARRLADQPGVETVVLAGSLAVGLGTSTSDVDIYLVGPHLADGRDQIFAGDVRVDVHRLAEAEVAALVGRVATATMRSDDGVALAAADLRTAVQLSLGEIMTADAPWRARLVGAAATLRRLAIIHWLTTAHYELEDLVGLLVDPDDADAAATVVRRLLLVGGKAVAAAADDLFLGEKWVWRQLRRSAVDDRRYVRFAALMRADPLAGDALTGTWSFAQSLLAASATLGWHHVDLAAWPPECDGGAGPRRNRELSIRPYVDGVLLAAPTGTRVRLSHRAALVWALCQGAELAELGRQVTVVSTQSSAYADLDERRATELVGMLTEAGLVG
jgi:hypothetical protein